MCLSKANKESAALEKIKKGTEYWTFDILWINFLHFIISFAIPLKFGGSDYYFDDSYYLKVDSWWNYQTFLLVVVDIDDTVGIEDIGDIVVDTLVVEDTLVAGDNFDMGYIGVADSCTDYCYID